MKRHPPLTGTKYRAELDSLDRALSVLPALVLACAPQAQLRSRILNSTEVAINSFRHSHALKHWSALDKLPPHPTPAPSHNHNFRETLVITTPPPSLLSTSNIVSLPPIKFISTQTLLKLYRRRATANERAEA